MYTEKSMMHMQSCCFANLYLMLFGLACVAGGILALPLIPPATQDIFLAILVAVAVVVA